MNKIEIIKEMIKWICEFNFENRNIDHSQLNNEFIENWVDKKIEKKLNL